MSGQARAAVRAKEFHFPLSVGWVGKRRIRARVAGKPAIEFATPPIFNGSRAASSACSRALGSSG